MSARSIVYYYSRTGNTKRIAEAVAQTLGADLEALRDTFDYSGVTGFFRGGRDAFRRREHEPTPLAHDPAPYDLVVIGQPVWAGRPVPVVNGFLKRRSLAGKRVALFVTFDGAGDVKCLDGTQALLTGARSVSRTSFREVGKHPEQRTDDARRWAASLKEG
jgi:flavodoxin